MEKTRKHLTALIGAFLIAITAFGQSKEFEISKNVDIYSTLFKKLSLNYVDELKPGELNKTAIDAMLESLDPYTVYISESEIEDYKFMTTGQYGGIGALIQKKGDYIVISEPYKGFPADKAGIIAGDKILEIDGQSMKGKQADQVSELMKGQPGTEFDLTIKRPGLEEPLTKTITREKIKIDDIPYYGIVQEDIGYIKLRSFTKHSGRNVRKAFQDLKNKNDLQGIILDLRNNGGGLLSEAVNITNLFVDKGQTIVKTKGKLPDKNKTYKTTQEPVDTDIPVTVLINGRSASASEIVSGSLQDLDRGVLIGRRTFGKGLVQNIIPLSYNTKAKITVAKYHIPSGRCIQEIDYSDNDGNGNGEQTPDSLIKSYKTKNGRTVYDRKGIDPDVHIEKEEPSRITLTLLSKNYIFNFVNRFYQNHDSIAPPREFEITPGIYKDFVNFLDNKDFEYTTKTEESLKKLKKTANEEKYSEFIEEEYKKLKEKLLEHKKNDLQTFKDEIKEALLDEIVTRYYYQQGAVESSLNNDRFVRKAIKFIDDTDRYQEVFRVSHKKPSEEESE
ncbi:MAG: S41 family peptidase [Bacteroidales bacterium]|nr:S41 family peptidase [Bacteroidales bacterium]MCF8337099.1 S41 family peptidase [Bacteroidales bacterium]